MASVMGSAPVRPFAQSRGPFLGLRERLPDSGRNGRAEAGDFTARAGADSIAGGRAACLPSAARLSYSPRADIPRGGGGAGGEGWQDDKSSPAGGYTLLGGDFSGAQLSLPLRPVRRLHKRGQLGSWSEGVLGSADPKDYRLRSAVTLAVTDEASSVERDLNSGFDADGTSAQSGFGSAELCCEDDECASSARLSQLASRFSRRSSYEVLRMDADGSERVVIVTRRELLQSSGLRPRDLRRVDPCLSANETSPVILVRKNAWLVSVQEVRAVIAKGYVFFFGHESKGTRACLNVLEKRFANQAEAVAQFELEVLEATLLAATQRLDKDLDGAAPKVTSLMGITPSFDGIEKLRIAKQELVDIGSRAESLRQCVLEVLEEEQDIRRMASTFMNGFGRMSNGDGSGNSSGADPFLMGHHSHANQASPRSNRFPPHHHHHHRTDLSGAASLWALTSDVPANGALALEDTRYASLGQAADVQTGSQTARRAKDEEVELELAEEEVELLLEYYLERAVSIHMEAEKLLAVARDMETSVQVDLSSRRYEVQRLELLLTVGAFAVAVGALISGIFGMNLTSNLEDDGNAFTYAVGIIVAGSSVIFVSIFKYIKEKSIF